MRHKMAAKILAAAFLCSAPLAAQNPPDLGFTRLIEDAIAAGETGVGTDSAASEGDLRPRPRPADLVSLAPPTDLYSDDELDALLAPVALYPDSLLAQVLVAATFPLQIVQADRLLAESETFTDEELAEAVDARDWDPSVLVLLTGFPDVVRRMAADLDGTERLGLAMAQQDGDVLDAVQRLRAEAEATGYLADNAAQVIARDGDRIVIEPTDPEVIYVPTYDARRAFVSAPTAPPVIQGPGVGTALSNPLVVGAIGFGSALLVNELFGDDDGNGGNGANNQGKDGWANYWRRDRRAIDWSDRQVYPRAYGWDDDRDRRRDVAWSRERDRYWDRGAQRWRREADDARRGDRVWEVRSDPRSGQIRLRPQDWSDVRAAIDRREALDARERERAQRDAREAARETARREEAARERRQDEAAADARDDRAAEKSARDRARKREAEEDREQAARAERERRQAQETERRRDRTQQADQDRASAAKAARDREQAQAAERARTQAQQTSRDRERAARAEREREQAQAAERERNRTRQADQDRERAAKAEREREQAQAAERARKQAQQADRDRERAADAERERELAQAVERERKQAQQARRQRDEAARAERTRAQAQAAERNRNQAQQAQRGREQAAQARPERRQADAPSTRRPEKQTARDKPRERRGDCPEGQAGRACRKGG